MKCRQKNTVQESVHHSVFSAKKEESSSLWRTLVVVGTIVAAGLIAYHNSFRSPFLLDDETAILENKTIRNLPNISDVLSPPENTTVNGRPIINLSLAINYAIGKLDVFGYHVFNLTVHILAGLTLFGIVRRTLRLPDMSFQLASAATPLALAVAVIWLVHPIQTESVTYIVQRAESIMGLFYLLTLYCAIRSDSSRTPLAWYVLATASCAMGMASKEVMVSAPVLVLAYDWIFLSGSFRNVFKQRWPLYIGLASSWAVLARLIHSHGGTVGFQPWLLSSLDYAATQCSVIIHYLRLSFYPHPLVLDYGDTWPVPAGLADVFPYAFLIIILLTTAVILLRYKRRLGYLALWFFFILAPTSSFVPIEDVIFEHRMYLPLAAIVTLVVVGGYAVAQTWLIRLIPTVQNRKLVVSSLWASLCVACVVSLCFLTVRRNHDYRSKVAIWQDTVKKRPMNDRAHRHLGYALIEANQPDMAIVHFKEAIRIYPDHVAAHRGYGEALILLHRYAESIAHLRQALSIDPSCPQSHSSLGLALAHCGRAREAIRHLQEAIRLRPDWPEPANNLAWLLATHENPEIRDGAQAVRLAEQACKLTERSDPGTLDTLAAAYAETDRFANAIRTAQEAVQLAEENGQTGLARDIRSRIDLYKQRRPYRQVRDR